MKLLASLLAGLSLTGCYATAEGHGHGRVRGAAFSLRLPPVLPALVLVEPGFSVVTDLDDEVFYSDGYYYTRQDQAWYRSHDHRTGWAEVDEQAVPRVISTSPSGRYRRYHSVQPVRVTQEREHGDDRR